MLLVKGKKLHRKRGRRGLFKTHAHEYSRLLEEGMEKR